MRDQFVHEHILFCTLLLKKCFNKCINKIKKNKRNGKVIMNHVEEIFIKVIS